MDSIREVSLAGGASERVVFSVSRTTAGAYSMNVNGLLGTLTVNAPPAPAPAPPAQVNWALLMGIIGGIIAAAAMVSMLVFMALMRRRGAGQGG
ncbi:MAG: hypothetical protein A2147_03700 [Chloroflexi bacterium RBG_16_57_8]|nr:MAG: hypothetical protein A2147_03700 [Chloroflexi bacterium RBG_16_57_8]